MRAALRIPAIFLTLLPLKALAAEAAPPAVAPVPAEAAAPLAAAPQQPPAKFAVEVGGYAKVGFAFQESDPANDLIGNADGFRMAAARVEMGATPMEKARIKLSIEGAFDQPTDALALGGEKDVRVRDAFFAYEFFPALVVTAGQFKAPFMAETLLPDGGLIFFDRSIVVTGARPPTANIADGLSLERQLGVAVSSQRLAVQDFGFSYNVGVFNGNGANQLVNDGGQFTPVARVMGDWQQKVALGVAVMTNPRTTGERPNLLSERRNGITADLSANYQGVHFLAAYTLQTRDFTTTEAPSDKAWGATAQLSYHHALTGFEPAYRFALLSPSELRPESQVMHHTLGLNWRPDDKPWRVYAAGVLRMESDELPLDNHGLELGAQLTF